MALRPMGVYLLTGTALYSQTKTTYHLTQMNNLAAESASLTLVANAELESSLELQGKSAIDSEEGLALQSESLELEMDAEREFTKAAAETAMGDALTEEAELLHEKSAQDALESEAAMGQSKEMHIQSQELHVQAERERAEAALDEEKSIALAEEAARSEEIATGAEEKAAEYEALALRREGQSIKDGEALLKTETGAMEDAEVMAACSPIPILDLVCDAVGAVIEAGYQGIAAFEGAKSAIESLSAAVAQRKEHAELIFAVEKQEEAARLAVEAEEFQVRADEVGGKATVEEAESGSMEVEAGEAQILGDEKLEESEQEELLAALDEEKATEEYAKAAQDESIALAEEESSIASQLESEELLTEGTSEEFEALTERTDAEFKEAKAGKMIKDSLGHGMHALGLALHAIITAALVVYVLIMKGLVKTVIPSVAKMWNGEHSLSTLQVLERICEFAIHVGIIIGSVASIPNVLSNFATMHTPSRIRALLYLAVSAGVIESFGLHSTHAAYCCHTKRMDAGSTLSTATLAGVLKLAHLLPVVLMETLVGLTIFGPGIFNNILQYLNPVLIWGVLLIMALLFSWVRQSRAMNTKAMSKQLSHEECEFLRQNDQQSMMYNNGSNVDKEYGSIGDRPSMLEDGSIIEEISLLTSDSGNTSAIRSSSSRSTSKCESTAPPNCIKRCSTVFHQYCDGLRLSSDLLVLTLMAVLMWHSLPLLKVLQPFAKSSLGVLSTCVSLPILIVAVLALGAVVHFVFVR